MSQETFRPTPEWPLQEVYKRDLHERIQQWGERVAPLFETMDEAERAAKTPFFEFLMTSVERNDPLTAAIVEAVDGYVHDDLEGPGMYGRGGGSVDSPAGLMICQYQFRGLYAIFEAGKASVTST